MTKKINRASLTDIVYHEIGMSYAESANLVDSVIEELINGLLKDGVVKISSFGSFYVRLKKQRIGRNPKTKKEAIIKSRRVISFYASNVLKDKVNT